MPEKRTIELKNVKIHLLEDGTIDEIFVNSEGKCVFHMEKIAGNHFWAVAQDDKNEVHLGFHSRVSGLHSDLQAIVDFEQPVEDEHDHE